MNLTRRIMFQNGYGVTSPLTMLWQPGTFREPKPSIPSLPLRSGVGGALSATEADDQVSATGQVLLWAGLDVTEANDLLSSSSVLAITAVVSLTEGNDSYSVLAVLPLSSTVSSVEQSDLITATGVVKILASLAMTEQEDTLSAAATGLIQGTLGGQEFDDSISASALLLVSAAVNCTEEDDALSSEGVFGSNRANFDVTEEDDSVTATAVHPVLAAMAVMEGDDAGSGSAALALFAEHSGQEQSDSVTATATVLIVGQSSNTEAGDTVSSGATVLIAGQATPTEAADTLAAASTLKVVGIVAVAEQDDAGSGSAALVIYATHSGTEENDTLNSYGRPYILATSSNAEADDTISASAKPIIQATFAKTDDNDAISATSLLITRGYFTVTEANDTSVGVSDIDLVGQVDTGGQEADDFLTTTGGPVIKAAFAADEESDFATAESTAGTAEFALAQEAQKASVSNLVTLYELDMTALGITPVRRFTPMTKNGSAVSFNGNVYLPLDMESEGFEWSGVSAPPAPKVRMSNVMGLIGGLVIGGGDLVGATLTRIRTFKRFLDGEPEADGTMHLPLDVYRIERKSAHNKRFVEFELATPFDHQGRVLPARQCLRDACTHIYRRYVDGAFVYEKATCPYVGSTYYDQTGLATVDPTKDRCGKRLSDCKKRFGTAPLPTRAFPGMARTRLM